MDVLCYNTLYLLEHIASWHMLVFRLYHNKRVAIKDHMISFSSFHLSTLWSQEYRLVQRHRPNPKTNLWEYFLISIVQPFSHNLWLPCAPTLSSSLQTILGCGDSHEVSTEINVQLRYQWVLSKYDWDTDISMAEVKVEDEPTICRKSLQMIYSSSVILVKYMTQSGTIGFGNMLTYEKH